MSAQQKLADLNVRCDRLWSKRHSVHEADAFYRDAGQLFHDHGATIEKLLTLAKDALGFLPEQVCCGNLQGGGCDENGDGEPPQCCMQPVYLRHDLAAVIHELTEDA